MTDTPTYTGTPQWAKSSTLDATCTKQNNVRRLQCAWLYYMTSHRLTAMATSVQYRFPQEYLYEGIKLSGLHLPKEAVGRTRSFPFHQDDVLIATYPKAGRFIH